MKDIFTKKPAFILDDKGISDYTSFAGAGFIPWSDVKSLKETVNSFKQKLILILLNNPNKYIDRTGVRAGNVRRSYFKV